MAKRRSPSKAAPRPYVSDAMIDAALRAMKESSFFQMDAFVGRGHIKWILEEALAAQLSEKKDLPEKP